MKFERYLEQWQTVQSEAEVALDVTKMLPGMLLTLAITRSKFRLLWQHPMSLIDYLQQLMDLSDTLMSFSPQSVNTRKITELIVLSQITTEVSALRGKIQRRISMVIEQYGYGDDGNDDSPPDPPTPVPIPPHEKLLEPQISTAS